MTWQRVARRAWWCLLSAVVASFAGAFLGLAAVRWALGDVDNALLNGGVAAAFTYSYVVHWAATSGGAHRARDR